MGYKYLPTDGEKAFTPSGIRRLFTEAVDHEGGQIGAVMKSSKYKKLIELWHASILAVAIYKLTGDKYFLLQDENPDIHFVKDPNTRNQSGFSAEILTLFGVENLDEVSLAKWTWDKKGLPDYDKADLLIVSRRVGRLDVDKFAQELSRQDWKFTRIWLGAIDASTGHWKIFLVLPGHDDPEGFSVDVNSDELPY